MTESRKRTLQHDPSLFNGFEKKLKKMDEWAAQLQADAVLKKMNESQSKLDIELKKITDHHESLASFTHEDFFGPSDVKIDKTSFLYQQIFAEFKSVRDKSNVALLKNNIVIPPSSVLIYEINPFFLVIVSENLSTFTSIKKSLCFHLRETAEHLSFGENAQKFQIFISAKNAYVFEKIKLFDKVFNALTVPYIKNVKENNTNNPPGILPKI